MRVAILRARWQIRVGVVLLPLTILGAISLGEERYEKAIGEPLLAHWTFNEGKEAGPVRDTSGNPAFAAPIENGVPRSRGVFGSALHLNGPHALRVVGAIGCDELAGITFSAWARPTDLSGYREIFRQECVNRLLFSFQANGSILALGLNIGGYLECDARIPRDVLLDGLWHHCAATFDGQVMRVYVDGKEVGSTQRVGKIALSRNVPAYIGSTGGGSEHFQGGLDDLRIYAKALSTEQISTLYRDGARSLAIRAAESEKRLAKIYRREHSFAATLARCRRQLRGDAQVSEHDLVPAFLAKLRADFPDEYEEFVTVTGVSPVSYLTSKGDDRYLEETKRMMGLLVEYKPLTDAQWKQQTPEQLRHWKEIEHIERQFSKLVARREISSDGAVDVSPEWIEILMKAGRHVTHRPRVSEAVAPYTPPVTPTTRDLSTEEAVAALRRDWLHQVDGDPTTDRIAAEIGWTRQLAERIANESSGGIDFANELDELRRAEEQLTQSDRNNEALYFTVRRIKRAIMFKNPTVDFDSVVFVDMPFPAGSEWPHETRHRLGYMAVPGGRLQKLTGLSPSGELVQLMPRAPLHGSFWRPDVSYDGTKILFSFKPHNEKAFHLYEIDVNRGDLKQLTAGIYDDFDPIYLPDGHIIFSTTRGHTYVRCMPPTNAYVLARCDANGKNIYLISRNNEPDYLPSVMNDGRIVYTRWEYTDKPLWRAQSLWTVNPDGTQVASFWGNQSVWPDLLKDARSIPNSRRVMFTGSAHHNWFSGSVGIIDQDKGHNFPDGLTKVTADVAWPESGNGPVDPIESSTYHSSGKYSAYYSPYPLSETDFLVSANRAGKFVLYLMDVDGNRELIYEGTNNVFHALPLRARAKPPVITDRVAWPTRENRMNPQRGAIYSSSVYQGAPKILAGKAKYLRVLNIEPKTYSYWHKRPYISTGPVVSMVQSEGVKRVLGTVPIEEDGSVAFHVSSGVAVHFQLLDERYRALQTMRSFTGVMPGERRGCLGCHKGHSVAPRQTSETPIALARVPREITPPPWGNDTVSYVRYVQPVLDKYCGKCHQGDGKAREKLDLTFRPGFRMFNEPYVTLIGRPTWGAEYTVPENPPPGFGIADTILVEAYGQRNPVAYETPPPMTYLSYKSRLIDMASSGKHNDVKVDPISLRKLIAWVDTMCPYRGAEEVRAIEDPEFQGIDWLSIRPQIRNAPVIVRPGPVD